MSDNFHFLLDATATGLVTWIGTLLTLIGLFITFQQAQKSRKAAEAARDAIGKLEDRVMASNLSDAHTQMAVLKEMVASSRFEHANIVLSLTDRMIVQAVHLLDKKKPNNKNAQSIKKI